MRYYFAFFSDQREQIDGYTLASALCDTMNNPTSVIEKALLQPWSGRMDNSK